MTVMCHKKMFLSTWCRGKWKDILILMLIAYSIYEIHTNADILSITPEPLYCLFRIFYATCLHTYIDIDSEEWIINLLLKFSTNPQTSLQSKYMTIRPAMGRTVMVTVNVYLSFNSIRGIECKNYKLFKLHHYIECTWEQCWVSEWKLFYILCVQSPPFRKESKKYVSENLSWNVFFSLFPFFSFFHFI